MKVIAKRIERVNRSGTSKAGNAYHIDQTMIYVDVPYDSPDGFGAKEFGYRYGDHTNFAKLEQLRGNLPAQIEVELSTQMNQYDQPETVIASVRPITSQKA